MLIVTHDSSFHTDDIFAVATLLLLEPGAEILRSRKPEDWERADYVVDTGAINDPEKRRFDHHMSEGAGERANGIPYASFGLVWHEYGERLAGGPAEAAQIDRKLVQAMDAIDNGVAIADYRFSGVRMYDISDYFNSYLNDLDPADGEARLDRVFKQCVEIAGELLVREIAKAKSFVQGAQAVRKAYAAAADKRLIELPTETLSWREILNEYPEPLYVVYPRPDNKWAIKTVPDLTKPYGVSRKDLPSAWAGKTDEDLQGLTGVSDALFAHRACFMAVTRSREGALKLAEIALNS